MKPEVYRAIIDEAHKHDLKVFIHATDLADAKDVVRSGVDALAHPVRRGPIDDEFIQLMKEHGVYQCSTVGVGDTSWIDEPVLAETMTAANIAMLKAEFGSTTEAEADAHALLLENLKRESDARCAHGAVRRRRH
jgi:imidazolonepropionase-like amidohydrolase